MTQYQNMAGNSGVTGYEIRARSILVEFKEGHLYEYSYASAGRENVERMKALAISGRGLSTYISTEVKDRYEEKWEEE